MPRLFRPEMSSTDDERRWVVGALVSSRCTRVSAALVGALGSGRDMLVEVAAAQTAAIPKEITARFQGLSASGGANQELPARALATLRQQLAEVQATLINQLVVSYNFLRGRVLAVGMHDPGIWEIARSEKGTVPLCQNGPQGASHKGGLSPFPASGSIASHKGRLGPFPGPGVGYLALSDPARLAELTGLNILDAFPARDLALGGQGGPVTALAEWILLRSQLRHRVFIDLGRTIRLTSLPAASADRPEAKVVAFDVGPGTMLLDLLVQRLTQGQQTFDAGGRLAVQGRRLPELIDYWLHDPYFEIPPPRWHPRGVRPERFLGEALRRAVQQKWSVQDLLCTATCFLAEMIVDALRRHLPADCPVEEILVSGGGVHNGFLLGELARLAPAPLVRLSDLPLPADALEPAGVAVLALLSIDQVPASQTSISNTATPRVLGRFTPGSPQNWNRLLEACTAASHHARPLRAAM